MASQDRRTIDGIHHALPPSALRTRIRMRRSPLGDDGVSVDVVTRQTGVGAAETRGGSKPWLVEGGPWERIEPLLPVVERRFR